MKETRQAKHHILKSKSLFTVAGIAIVVCLFAVSLIFIPRLIDKYGAHAGGTLRNPDISSLPDEGEDNGISLYKSENEHWALSVSREADKEKSLYAVPSDAILSLFAKEETTTEALADALLVTRADTGEDVNVKITGGEGGGYFITPLDGAWQTDALYRVTVSDKDGTLPDFSAAFQTATPFEVKNIYPRDKCTDVPIDTGIEITFTAPVTKADLAAYITVTPSFSGSFELYPDGKTAVIVPDRPLAYATQYAVQIKDGLVSDDGQVIPKATVYNFCTETKKKAAEDEIRVSLSLDGELITDPGKNGVLGYRIRYYQGEQKTEIKKTELYVRLYAFSSPDAAIAAMQKGFVEKKTDPYNQNEADISTDGMKLVYEGTPEGEKNSENTNARREEGWLSLPNVDSGVYLLVLDAKVTDTANVTHKATAKEIYQISPLRAYTEAANGELLLWVNRTDAPSKESFAAANTVATAYFFENSPWLSNKELSTTEKSAFRTVSATADTRGIAAFHCEDDDAALILLTHGDDHLILATTAPSSEDENLPRIYAYTDRAVYFADDTVRLFGFIGRADAETSLPKTLDLQIADSSTKRTVSVSEDGSFEASFPIEKWKGTYLSYTLSATDGDGKKNVLYYGHVRVTQEEKPEYSVTVAFDELFYDYDDTEASVTLHASYFDGTPAPGLSFSVQAYPLSAEPVTVVTDNEGTATYRYPLKHTSIPSYTDAVMLSVTAQLIGYETTTLSSTASCYYFHSSGILQARRIDALHSEVKLYALDTSRLLSMGDFSYENGYPENTKGAPLSDTVSVVLEKIEYIKTKTGTVYDPISKTFSETYRYDEKRTRQKSYRASVQNGTLTLEHIDASDLRGYYQYKITWDDIQTGHSYTQTLYASRGNAHLYDYYRGEEYSLGASKTAAALGDDITVSLMRTGIDTPITLLEESVLFTEYIGTKGCTNSLYLTDGNASYSFTFGEAHTPGTMVFATVFDGVTYHKVSPVTVAYDYTDTNRAEITVTADRDTYKPGEWATVTVSSPALSGGVVLVSIVDEACFALGEQYTEPLKEYFASFGGWGIVTETENGDRLTLYSSCVYPARNARLSLIGLLSNTRSDDTGVMEDAVENESAADSAPGTGENGGSNANSDVYIRESFADNPAFVRVSLDENGVGVASLTVPDNMTTWRITAIGANGVGEQSDKDAFSSAVKIGMTTSHAVCTLPFFVNVNIPRLFLLDDEIAFSVRGAGTLRTESPDASVTYEATLTNERGEVISTHKISAGISETAWISLGKQASSGEYSLLVKGTYTDTAADAVRVPFYVTETSAIIEDTKITAPQDITKLSPAAFPLHLSFYDGEDALYFEVLDTLLSSFGERTEAIAARATALQIAEELGRTSMWYASESSFDGLIDTLNGYVGFLPLNAYAEGDAVLSAKVLYATPTLLSPQKKAELIPLYYTLLADKKADENDISASLLALASMGEPILGELHLAASHIEGMGTEAKLYLAAAFSAIGDTENARAVLSGVTEALAHTHPDNSVSLEGKNTEETIRQSALALLCAAKVDPTLAEGLVRYLQSHTSTLELYVLELAAFLNYHTPKTAEASVLSYRIGNGDKVTVGLENGRTHSLTLTKSDFEDFVLLSSDEDIVVAATYGTHAKDVLSENTQDKDTLKIERTITPYDMENGIYEVTLVFSGKTDRDALSFSVSETLPRGARYVRAFRDSADGIYLSNKGDGRLFGTLYIYNPQKGDAPLFGAGTYSYRKTFSYLIRGAVMGKYLFEPTLAVSREAGIYAVSDTHRVTIKDGAWEIK